jgi:hypothetical protein
LCDLADVKILVKSSKTDKVEKANRSKVGSTARYFSLDQVPIDRVGVFVHELKPKPLAGELDNGDSELLVCEVTPQVSEILGMQLMCVRVIM